MKQKNRYIFSLKNNSFYDTNLDDVSVIPKPFIRVSNEEYDRIRILLATNPDLIVTTNKSGNAPIVVHKNHGEDIETLRAIQKKRIHDGFLSSFNKLDILEIDGIEISIKKNIDEINLSISMNMDFINIHSIHQEVIPIENLIKKLEERHHKIVQLSLNLKDLLSRVDTYDTETEIQCIEWEN
ncbi:hypothetical protein [Proteus mirabilis]|uniref:hypothetical protein n=1 Tax=Proteus mirabilis TaxID=584 RepID=UPI0034D5180B